MYNTVRLSVIFQCFFSPKSRPGDQEGTTIKATYLNIRRTHAVFFSELKNKIIENRILNRYGMVVA